MTVIPELKQFVSLTAGQRLLALDLGTKTIGIAVADDGWHLSNPLKTITRSKFTNEANGLAILIKRENIGGLIIGLPLMADGTFGRKAQSCNQFAKNISALPAFASLPIFLFDERYSTAAATDILDDAAINHDERKTMIDSIAASIILTNFLEAAKNL